MVEILSQRHVPIPVAKQLLEKHLSGFEENPVLARVYEYLRMFSKCGAAEAEAAMKALTDIGFSSMAAAMLVNLVPQSLEEAKALLGNIDGGYEDEKIGAALEVLARHCGGEGEEEQG